ncbi:hypothetical protein BDZ85DRAFT_48500 [Elsinoe ampelina]|uniref:Heterokaryon incompatibility domain-containing protein n=1 Tax=Elsinoe ampelina TaxID=302913 RepID=A0A6A6GKV0_9PEZI|nr:hypothetical protein BDZ85DRAFT_48500 [Elsinoe ampelina]
METILPAPPNASPCFIPWSIDVFEYIPNGAPLQWGKGILRYGEPFVSGTAESPLEHVQELSLDAKTSYLQALLIWGLLFKFLGHVVPRDSLIHVEDSHGRWLLAPREDVFNDFISRWKDHFVGLVDTALHTAHRGLTELLCSADLILDKFDVVDRPLPDEAEDSEGTNFAYTLLTIRLLINRLRLVLSSALRIITYNRTSRIWSGKRKTLREEEEIYQWMSPRVYRKLVLLRGPVPLSVRLLLHRFAINGWCPTRARYLAAACDYISVSYISRIVREHDDLADHSRCVSKGKCVAHDLSQEQERSYEVRHVNPDCSCTSITVQIEHLCRIIQGGRMPVVSVNLNDPNLDLQLHEADSTLRYAAISHVWSDGLGNPKSNALPHCQMTRIARLVSKADLISQAQASNAESLYNAVSIRRSPERAGRTFFWMDTLCIPVRAPPGQDAKHLRLRTIRHITPVFTAARQVIVLDSDLTLLAMKTPGHDRMSAQEIEDQAERLAGHVLGCKWLQRAWTLEEGALAARCYFVGAESALVNLGEAVSPLRLTPVLRRIRKRSLKVNAALDPLHRPTPFLIRLKHAWRPSIGEQSSTSSGKLPVKFMLRRPLNFERRRQGYGSGGFPTFTQVVEAWNNLLQRSASRPVDLLLIFAHLLEFDIGEVLRTPDHLCLFRMLLSLRAFPLDLMFIAQRVPRGDLAPKDAWIPSEIAGEPISNWTPVRLSPDDTYPDVETRSTELSRLYLKLADCEASTMVLMIAPKIPFATSTYLISLPGAPPQSKDLIVEHNRSDGTETVPVSTDNLEARRDSYEDCEPDACLLIIQLSHMISQHGCMGAGARYGIVQRNQRDFVVRFDTSFRVWTGKQWFFRHQTQFTEPAEHACPLPDQVDRIYFDHGNMTTIFRRFISAGYVIHCIERQR